MLRVVDVGMNTAHGRRRPFSMDERVSLFREETGMKLLATLASMVVLLAVGIRLMFYGFQGLVSAPSSLGLEFLGFAAGLICFISGIACGVLLLKPSYRT